MNTILRGKRVLSLATSIFFLLGAVVASAQDKTEKAPVTPRIAIINVEYAMQKAKAVETARSQMKNMSEKYNKEIATEESALRTLEQELQQQRTILAPEAYAQRREEFQKKVAALQQKARSLRQAMDRGFKNTMQRIQLVLFEETAKVAEELGYNLVLPSSQIIVSIGQFNITPQALERLDKRLPDVTLTMEKKKNEQQGKPAAPAR